MLFERMTSSVLPYSMTLMLPVLLLPPAHLLAQTTAKQHVQACSAST